MSLIHDALKQMGRPGTLEPIHTTGLSLAPVETRRNGFVAMVAAFAAVIAVGGLAYAGWKTMGGASMITAVAAPLPAAVSPVAVTLQLTPIPAVAVVPPSTPLPDVVVLAAADAPSRTAVTLPEAIAALPAPDVPPMATAVPTKTVVEAAPALAPVRMQQVELKTSAAAPRVVAAGNQVSVEQRFSLFLEAMRIKDMAAAQGQLVGLRRQLTRSSISLVRAEAWFAYSSGDAITARREYQEVIERMPGDEEASINLASMEAGQNQIETARQILSDALRANPESEVLKSTLGTFGGRR